MWYRTLGFIWCSLAGLVTLPAAQCELDKFSSNDGLFADAFGHDMAVSGDRLIVGAPNDDEGGTDRGAAFIFERQGSSWVQTAKLTANDAANFDNFGTTVALDGDRAVVGAVAEDDGGFDSGAAYVFEYDGTNWSQDQKLVASNAGLGDLFSIGLDLEGNRIVVGACQQVTFDTFGFGKGRAYVFDYNGSTWVETVILEASEGVDGDRFGASTALDGDRILIGSETDNAPSNNSGSAYVFDLVGSTWMETQKITASDGGGGDFFGFSGDLCGDFAVVGAPLDNSAMSDVGSAYVFELQGSTWVEVAKLENSNASDNDQMGLGVSIDGSLAAVGAHSSGGVGTGAALVFDGNNGWTEKENFIAGDTIVGDAFGYSVLVDGTRLFVSARLDDGSGSAYEFAYAVASSVSRNGTGCNPNGYVEVSPAALGGTWQTTVDIVTPGAVASIIGVVDSGPLGVKLAIGEVLINVFTPLISPLNIAVGSHSVPIPFDCTLVGITVYTQAATFAPGDVRLNNAIDVTFGL